MCTKSTVETHLKAAALILTLCDISETNDFEKHERMYPKIFVRAETRQKWWFCYVAKTVSVDKKKVGQREKRRYKYAIGKKMKSTRKHAGKIS